MNINRLSATGKAEVLSAILSGIQRCADNDGADSVEVLLDALVPVMDDLGAGDFFGTEGWEHYCGLDD